MSAIRIYNLPTAPVKDGIRLSGLLKLLIVSLIFLAFTRISNQKPIPQQNMAASDTASGLSITRAKVTCESCHGNGHSDGPIIIIVRNIDGFTTENIEGGETYEIDIQSDKQILGGNRFQAIDVKTGEAIGLWNFEYIESAERSLYLENQHKTTREDTVQLVQRAYWTAPSELQNNIEFRISGLLSSTSVDLARWNSFQCAKQISAAAVSGDYSELLNSLTCSGNQFRLAFEAVNAAQMNLSVFSLQGTTLWTREISASAGLNEWVFDHQLERNRVYIFQLNSGDFHIQRKFFLP